MSPLILTLVSMQAPAGPTAPPEALVEQVLAALDLDGHGGVTPPA